MLKLNLTSNQPVLELKINEIIDVVHELQCFIEQQNTMIAKQLEVIKEQRESISIQDKRIKSMIETLPEVLEQAVKAQDIDIFQDWLKEK